MNGNEQSNLAEQVLESMWRFLSQSQSDTSFWQREVGYAVTFSSPAQKSHDGIHELESPLSDS